MPGTGVEPVRPCGPADFTYHHSFRYHASKACFVVWTIPLPYAVRHLGRGRLVSTLSHAEHGLSSGSPSARPVKGSPNLTPVHPRVSPWGTPASPLRLPVPPPGRVRSRQHRQASRECKRLDRKDGGSRKRPHARGDGAMPRRIPDADGGWMVRRWLRWPVRVPGWSRHWRLRSESNRRTRLCRPLHDHSATQPGTINRRRRTTLDRRRAWSGKRDSNSRPQPWQGCALPTELFPRIGPPIVERDDPLSRPRSPRHTSSCPAGSTGSGGDARRRALEVGVAVSRVAGPNVPEQRTADSQRAAGGGVWAAWPASPPPLTAGGRYRCLPTSSPAMPHAGRPPSTRW